MATTDEQKKAILPFLQVRHVKVSGPLGSLCNMKLTYGCAMQRADEIGKVEPKVAYYCRLYAIQQVSAYLIFLELVCCYCQQ